MKTAIKLEPMDVNSIPFQEASLDIWDKKYRLTAKDGSPIATALDRADRERLGHGSGSAAQDHP